MNIGKAIRRNQIEGAFILLGIVILIIQFAVAKHFLADGGIDHTNVMGAPLDDTYIHCRFAENLLSGHGFSFNSGCIISADTSPLWVGLIALGGLVTSHFDLVAFILSAIAWLLLAPAVYRIARYVFLWEQSFSIAAGICMLLSPRLLVMNLSGMETAFAVLLVLIACEMHIRSREMMQLRIREAIILGIGIAVRPEFYLLVLIVCLDWLYLVFKKKISVKKLIGFAMPLLVTVLIVSLIPLSEPEVLGYEGIPHLLYQSSIVQGAGLRFPPDFYYIGRSFYILLENFWWLILLLLCYSFSFKIPRIKGSNGVLVIFMISLPVIQGFVAPQYRHFGRYIFPIIPLMILSLFALLRKNMLSDKGIPFFRNMKDKKRTVYLIVIASIFSLPLAIKWIGVYAESVRNINDQHLAAESWIQENISEKDKLAVDDVGAIGYFTKRNLIDLTGLIDAEFYLLQNNQSLVWQEARESGAKYFAIYTKLNPSFYQFAKDSLELVKEFRVRLPLVASADTVMSIFRVKGDANATR